MIDKIERLIWAFAAAEASAIAFWSAWYGEGWEAAAFIVSGAFAAWMAPHQDVRRGWVRA